MNGGSPRCYANAEERAAFLCELQKISKRESRGYLGVAPRGDPLFQEHITPAADGKGFEFRGIALSPTVQQAGPAGVTPSQLLAAAEGGYSPGSQRYRGSVMPTWHPNAMVPTPVRLPRFQHPIGKGFGTEVVGTNRKRLGERAGPLGETRSNIPLPRELKMCAVAYQEVLAPKMQKALPPEDAVGDWIVRMEAACDI